jgi:hypothetical protein
MVAQTSCIWENVRQTHVHPPSYKGGSKNSLVCPDDSVSDTSASVPLPTLKSLPTSKPDFHVPSTKEKKMKIDFKSDEYKRALMSMLGKVTEGGIQTKQIASFMEQDEIKAKFNNNGQLVVSGIKLEIPDMAAAYKKNLEDELARISKIACDDKVSISNWMKGMSTVCFILIGILSVIVFIYGISNFFCKSDTNL